MIFRQIALRIGMTMASSTPMASRQRTDTGTILIMIGFGLTGGAFVLTCYGYGKAAPGGFKTAMRRFPPLAIAVGLAIAAAGLFTHHY